jgi:hypothetical protein
MAYSFTVNQTPANNGEAIYNLKARLVAAGWQVKASGSGATYGASSDVVTTPALMNAPNAWFRIADPANMRELTFQRTSAGSTYWRIKYSASAKFTGGSPSATQTPSAADEQLVLGSGTDAVPAGATWTAGDGAYRQQIGADSAAPYTFWMGSYPIGGGAPNSGLVFDVLNSPSPGDADPALIYIGIAGNQNFAVSSLCAVTSNTSTARCVAYLKKGLAGEAFVPMPAQVYSAPASGQFAPTNASTNPQNGKDDEFPILFARSTVLTVPVGYKGMGTVMRWHGTARTTGDTLNVVAAKDRIIFGEVSLPWDGVTTPVL